MSSQKIEMPSRNLGFAAAAAALVVGIAVMLAPEAQTNHLQMTTRTLPHGYEATTSDIDAVPGNLIVYSPRDEAINEAQCGSVQFIDINGDGKKIVRFSQIVDTTVKEGSPLSGNGTLADPLRLMHRDGYQDARVVGVTTARSRTTIVSKPNDFRCG